MSKGMHLTRVATQLSINQDTDKETMPTCVASACRRHGAWPGCRSTAGKGGAEIPSVALSSPA